MKIEKKPPPPKPKRKSAPKITNNCKSNEAFNFVDGKVIC